MKSTWFVVFHNGTSCQWPSPLLMSGALKGAERTLALVKPDAVRSGNASDIKRDIEAAGFSIVAEREMLLSPEFVERFYAEHAGQPFYPDLVDFMSR
jgi:nucleoside diphosphate kinase